MTAESLARLAYDRLHAVPGLYAAAYDLAQHIDLPAPVQGGRRGKPSSRPPAGSDVAARTACVRAARALADTDMLLAEAADWPALPWQPHRLGGPGWEPCRTCAESGLVAADGSPVVEVVQGTFVPLHVADCPSCGGDGWTWTWARRDASSPELVPPHPHVVRSVVERVRGKVGGLEVRDLHGDPTPALRAALAAHRALCGYASPTAEELDALRREDDDEARECEECSMPLADYDRGRRCVTCRVREHRRRERARRAS